MPLEKILAEFREIASSPKKQLDKYLSDGKKVVAVAPVYTPEEIIHSMGIVPMGVWGADRQLTESKQYFPAFLCSITQSITDLGVIGAYKGVSAIVIPYLCDSLKVLGENWKYAVPSIPFIPMPYPQNRGNEAGMAFTKSGYERVIKDLEKNTGLSFDEDSLGKSIRVYNEHNRCMRRLSEYLSDYPEIDSVSRSAIFKSAYFMLKEEHTALVEKLLSIIEEFPPVRERKTRIITSGILADNPSLLELFNENNIQIVADDVAHESRQYRVDTPEGDTPLTDLARKFSRMDNCSVLYDRDKKRAEYIAELAQQHRADGVVVLMTKFCDPEEFDYVMIKNICEREEIPVALIEVDRQMVDFEQGRTILETFKDIIHIKGGSRV